VLRREAVIDDGAIRDRTIRMTRLVVKIIAVLAILLGLVWVGQGTGYFPYPASSSMINQSPWILYGAILALVGFIALFAIRRRPV
jgi:fatty acid desaturase